MPVLISRLTRRNASSISPTSASETAMMTSRCNCRRRRNTLDFAWSQRRIHAAEDVAICRRDGDTNDVTDLSSHRGNHIITLRCHLTWKRSATLTGKTAGAKAGEYMEKREAKKWKSCYLSFENQLLSSNYVLKPVIFSDISHWKIRNKKEKQVLSSTI